MTQGMAQWTVYTFLLVEYLGSIPVTEKFPEDPLDLLECKGAKGIVCEMEGMKIRSCLAFEGS